MAIRNIKRNKTPTELYRFVNGKKKYIKRVYKIINGKAVIVWNISNDFKIEVARNPDGKMIANFQLENFVGCTEVKIDFGDGSNTTLNSDNFAVTHTYDDTIDTATIEIVAENCTKLNQNFISNASYDYNISILSITLPDSTEEIGDYAIYEFLSLENIKFNNLKIIGNYCFQYCEKLQQVDLKKVQTIGQNAFNSCYSLAEITIPDSVTSIGNYAFYECTGLKKVDINQSCAISNSQFYSCTSLSEVIISKNVNGIGEYAFYGCSSLTSITIPSSVTSIGYGAFDGRYITQINCNFTRQDAVTKGNLSQIWAEMQQGTAYTIHCTDGDIVLQGE